MINILRVFLKYKYLFLSLVNTNTCKPNSYWGKPAAAIYCEGQSILKFTLM